jgi:hypothetical protein
LADELPDEEVFTVDIESQCELYFRGASRIEMDPDSEPALDLYSKCLKKEPYTTLSPFSKKSAPIMKQNMRYIYEVCKPELLPYHRSPNTHEEI